MHCFSNLFDKILYMFRTGPLSIIRNISTLYTSSRYLLCQFCWLSASVDRMTMLADSQQNQHDKYLLRVYSVEIFLMMDSGPVRNMQSILSNKFEKFCILLVFIIRTLFAYPSKLTILSFLFSPVSCAKRIRIQFCPVLSILGQIPNFVFSTLHS